MEPAWGQHGDQIAKSIDGNGRRFGRGGRLLFMLLIMLYCQARSWQVVHHSCTPAGAPDLVALRAIPPPCLGLLGQTPHKQIIQQQSDQTNDQKINKNNPLLFIDQKSTMDSKLIPEAVFMGSWGHFGPKSQVEPQKCVRPPFVPPSWGATWGPKSNKHQHKINQQTT